MKSVEVSSNLDLMIRAPTPAGSEDSLYTIPDGQGIVCNGEAEKRVAEATLDVINSFSNKPEIISSTGDLLSEDVQKTIAEAVKEKLIADQPSLLAPEEATRLREVVVQTARLVEKQTIDIRKIAVMPKGDATYYHAFKLDVSGLNLQPDDRHILIQNLRDGEERTLTAQGGVPELRPENYIIHALADFDDIS